MQYKERLDQSEARYNELTAKMTDPAVINDSDQYRKVSKARSELEEVVDKYRSWKKADQELRDARQMLSEPDPDLQQMAELEVARLQPELTQLESDIRFSFCPKIRMTKRTLFLKFAKARAAMRHLFSPTRCSACTPATLKSRAGK